MSVLIQTYFAFNMVKILPSKIAIIGKSFHAEIDNFKKYSKVFLKPFSKTEQNTKIQYFLPNP